MGLESHVGVTGGERSPLPGAKLMGAVSPEEWVEVTLLVRRKAPLPEPDARAAPLTRAELGSRYGASFEDVEKTARVLSAYGLEVLEADAGRRRVRAAGPASAIERAFLVRLFRYEHPSGNYRGRVGSVHVPRELGAIVVGVFGLDTRRVARKRNTTARLGALSGAAAANRPFFFPGELAELYGFPAGDGEGEAIGLLEFGGGYFAGDLTLFCKAAKLAAPPRVVPMSVGGTATDLRDGAEGEVMLDIEVVAGVCPKATIVVYFSGCDERGWVDAIDAAVHDVAHKPSVLSISWGYAEDAPHAWTPQAIAHLTEALQEAALLGITVFVAAGDDGSSDAVLDGHAHVDFPAVVPYVTAVGGTALRARGGAVVSEVAWKDGEGLRQEGGGCTGGGVSTKVQRPSWQDVDIASVNPGSIRGRVIPDVAADASAHTGYFMVMDGKGGPGGGTSAAAPLWASLVVRANSALSLAGRRRIGYLTPLLYQPGARGRAPLGALVCRDITSGNNSTAAIGGYSSGRGYDAVTGWGVPRGDAFLEGMSPLRG